jgi:hypothetical protein
MFFTHLQIPERFLAPNLIMENTLMEIKRISPKQQN